jgi:hypothetical protein
MVTQVSDQHQGRTAWKRWRRRALVLVLSGVVPGCSQRSIPDTRIDCCTFYQAMYLQYMKVPNTTFAALQASDLCVRLERERKCHENTSRESGD